MQYLTKEHLEALNVESLRKALMYFQVPIALCDTQDKDSMMNKLLEHTRFLSDDWPGCLDQAPEVKLCVMKICVRI